MNKSPLNYFITVASGAILWVITAIFIGGSFSETLTLAESSPEYFAANLRMFLGIAASLGIISCFYWYYFGELDSTAGNLKRAKNVYLTSFILQIIFSIALLVGLVLMNLAEGILTFDWLIVFGLISIHTWIFFWFCTYTMSPRTVRNVPFFK